MYSLSYTFVWPTNAWDLLFLKYQSKNPGITFTRLSLNSHGYFLALSPISFPVPASKYKHLSPALVQQSHIFPIQMFNLSRCCRNKVDKKYVGRINKCIYSSLSRPLPYFEMWILMLKALFPAVENHCSLISWIKLRYSSCLSSGSHCIQLPKYARY